MRRSREYLRREYLLRSFALEAARGIAFAALFIAALCALDLHGLGTLIAQDRASAVPLLLMFAGLGGTFAAAALGTGLYLSAVRPDDDHNCGPV